MWFWQIGFLTLDPSPNALAVSPSLSIAKVSERPSILRLIGRNLLIKYARHLSPKYLMNRKRAETSSFFPLMSRQPDFKIVRAGISIVSLTAPFLTTFRQFKPIFLRPIKCQRDFGIWLLKNKFLFPREWRLQNNF